MNKAWLQEVSGLVPILILIGAILGTYITFRVDISLIQKGQQDLITAEMYLKTADTDAKAQTLNLERRLLIVESTQKEIRSDQLRLELKLDKIIDELGTIGIALTELNTINKSRKVNNN